MRDACKQEDKYSNREITYTTRCCKDSPTPPVRYCYQEQKDHHEERQEETDMKGYSVDFGYMGYVDGRYMLFASEGEYRSYLED